MWFLWQASFGCTILVALILRLYASEARYKWNYRTKTRDSAWRQTLGGCCISSGGWTRWCFGDQWAISHDNLFAEAERATEALSKGMNLLCYIYEGYFCDLKERSKAGTRELEESVEFVLCNLPSNIRRRSELRHKRDNVFETSSMDHFGDLKTTIIKLDVQCLCTSMRFNLRRGCKDCRHCWSITWLKKMPKKKN